jgi:uncharacterized membrane protein YeiB
MPGDSTSIRRAFAIRAPEIAWQIAIVSLLICTKFVPLMATVCGTGTFLLGSNNPINGDHFPKVLRP